MTPFAKPAGWWLCPNQPRCGHPAVLHDIGDYEDEAPRCCVPDCPCGQVPEAEPEPAPDASHDDRTLVTVRTRFADYLARSRARDTARDKALREVFAAALGDGDYPAGMTQNQRAPQHQDVPRTAEEAATRIVQNIYSLYALLPKHRQQKPAVRKAVDFAATVSEPETWRARIGSGKSIRDEANEHWCAVARQYICAVQAGDLPALADGDYPAGMSKPKQYQEPETATMTGTHDRGVLPSADPQHSDPQPVDPAEPARTQEQQQNPPAPPDTEINPEKDAARP